MKNKILITLLIFLSSCGYSSIYKDNRTKDFKLSIIKASGDNEFNNLIKKELKLFSNNNSEKEYFLKSLSVAHSGCIFVAFIIAFLRHLSRSYSWIYFLETIVVQPQLSLMYHLFMFGYILYLSIPRSC